VLGIAVNTLIKNKNTYRKGLVYFVRLRDRSSLNYLVKLTLSGVVNSVGIPKNKKAAAELKKEIDAATPAASKVDP